MRIAPKDIAAHLKRGLNPRYFVFGEEPLQQLETLEAIRQEAKRQGFSERYSFEATAHAEWALLFQQLNTSSLFAEKKLLTIHLAENKPGKNTLAALEKLAKLSISSDTLLLVTAQKIDYKTQQGRWFTDLERHSCTIFAKPLSREEMLPWLKNRLQIEGFTPAPEAIQSLLDHTEGNLLAAAQTIEKLKLCDTTPVLTLENIRQAIGLESRFTVFDLIDAALSGDTLRTSQIFNSLKSEEAEPILILWAIAKEVQTSILMLNKLKTGLAFSALCTEFGIWKRKELLMKTFLNRTSLPALEKILQQALLADSIIKNRSKGKIWDLLFLIVLNFTRGTDEGLSWEQLQQ